MAGAAAIIVAVPTAVATFGRLKGHLARWLKWVGGWRVLCALETNTTFAAAIVGLGAFCCCGCWPWDSWRHKVFAKQHYKWAALPAAAAAAGMVAAAWVLPCGCCWGQLSTARSAAACCALAAQAFLLHFVCSFSCFSSTVSAAYSPSYQLK